MGARRAARVASSSTTRCCPSTPRIGFEYGYSVVHKDALVAWEAQFGDFVQRRADHHRPVPRRRRGQVGPDVGTRAAAAARLRRPGPRAQLGAPRAVPHAAAPKATSRSQSPTTAAQYFHLLRRQVRRDRRDAARRDDAEVAAAPQRGVLADRRVRRRSLPRGARRSRPSPTRTAVRRVVFATGKVAVQAATERDTRNARRSPSSASSSSIRGPKSRSPRSSTSTRTRRTSCGCRRSPATWVRGRTCGASSPVSSATSSRSSRSRGSSRARRLPVPPASHAIEQTDLFDRALDRLAQRYRKRFHASQRDAGASTAAGRTPAPFSGSGGSDAAARCVPRGGPTTHRGSSAALRRMTCARSRRCVPTSSTSAVGPHLRGSWFADASSSVRWLPAGTTNRRSPPVRR